MKKLAILIFAALAVTACNNDKQTSSEGHDSDKHSKSENPKTKELMDLHDAIMPKMGEIMTSRKLLENLVNDLDSLYKVNPTADLKMQKQNVLDVIDQLKVADKSMMDWMHQYKSDTLKSLDAGQQDAYIADQRSRMENVKDQTLNAISSSKETLKNVNK
ncbi:hypothetical protein DSL64_15705 [Dyadobacter luteus]|uniref:Viral A-type inclusion protein n=1 Tax=Dyadobacter luteus TaxID=2259619 RepID=A0A3D8YAK1_9BACT|nr:hypothetical protein [Dyadobacter luteus]REA60120.1 hypothetical protein DSL64_15705 [Dyadobacter luteus]